MMNVVLRIRMIVAKQNTSLWLIYVRYAIRFITSTRLGLILVFCFFVAISYSSGRFDLMIYYSSVRVLGKYKKIYAHKRGIYYIYVFFSLIVPFFPPNPLVLFYLFSLSLSLCLCCLANIINVDGWWSLGLSIFNTCTIRWPYIYISERSFCLTYYIINSRFGFLLLLHCVWLRLTNNANQQQKKKRIWETTRFFSLFFSFELYVLLERK
jgi:hypothetical protein